MLIPCLKMCFHKHGGESQRLHHCHLSPTCREAFRCNTSAHTSQGQPTRLERGKWNKLSTFSISFICCLHIASIMAILPSMGFCGKQRNIDFRSTVGYQSNLYQQPCQFNPPGDKLCMQYLFVVSILYFCSQPQVATQGIRVFSTSTLAIPSHGGWRLSCTGNWANGVEMGLACHLETRYWSSCVYWEVAEPSSRCSFSD